MYNISMLEDELQLACRFSLPPNSLGYCGRNSAPEKFKKCVIDGECDSVEKELENFIVLNPYLETLSTITKKSKFSRKVIEAYWLGNDELEKARASDYQMLLANFAKQGVPSWFVDDLRVKPPKKFIPHHLFQVLHVGVGKASGSVPFNLESINNCMIRWGKVTQILGDKLEADLNSLDGKVDSGSLNGLKVVQKKCEAKFIPGFLPGLKIGDGVAVHWHQAVKILSTKEVDQLDFWTKKVINSLG